MVDANRQASSAPVDSNALQSFSGGLNTAGGVVSLPRGDSPYMWNTIVNDRGHCETRGGTRSLVASTASVLGDCSYIFRTPSGRVMLARKIATFLYVFFLSVDVDNQRYATQIWVDEVFPDSATDDKVDFVYTSESIPRLIMTSGVSAPHQLSIAEFQTEVDEGSTWTTFTIDSELLEYANVTQCTVFVGDTRVVVSGVSYSGGTLNVTLPTQAAFTGTVTLLWLTYQWWCQATLLEGKDIYDTSLRFNTESTDTAVEIPINLLRNAVQFDNGNYNIRVLSSTDRSDTYTNVAGGGVSAADEFSFSSGAIYESGKNVPNGLGFVTFGGNEASGNPSEVHYVKQIRPRFNNSDTTAGTSNLVVRVNGTDITYRSSSNITSNEFTNTDSKGESFTLRERSSIYDEDGGVIAAGGTWEFVDFGCAEEVGVDWNSVVEVVWVDKTGVTSSGSVSGVCPVGKLRNGYAVPAYGIQEHADYSSDSLSMPRNIALFQGRLVFAGFPGRPNRVVFSEVFGTSISSYQFQNFQTLEEQASSTSPVFSELASDEPYGFITTLASSAGSLLVFTEQRVLRVYGGSDNPVSATSVISTVVANVGCVNRFSAVAVDNAVYFLSQSGVYRVAPSLEIGDFAVRLVSLNVNNQLKHPNNSLAAHLNYDSLNERLYVAVADSFDAKIATRMFVYYVPVDAWTEYTTFYGKWYSTSTSCYDGIVLSQTAFEFDNEGAIRSHTLVLDQNINVDFMRYGVNSSVGDLTQVSETITVSTGAELSGYFQITSFRMCEFLGVEDIGVYRGTERLTFGTDFRKLSENEIVITTPIFLTDELTFFPVDENGDYPFVYSKVLEDLEYSVDVLNPTVDGYVNWSTDETVDDTTWTYTAYEIPYYVASPVFIRNDLNGQKWARDTFVLLSNRNFQEKWSFVNASVYESTFNDEEVDLASVVGKWRYPVAIRIGKIFNAVDYVTTAHSDDRLKSSYDWDVATFDIGASWKQSNRLLRLGYNIKGVDDTMQVFFSCYSKNKRFEIVAYQLIAQELKRTSRL